MPQLKHRHRTELKDFLVTASRASVLCLDTGVLLAGCLCRTCLDLLRRTRTALEAAEVCKCYDQVLYLQMTNQCRLAESPTATIADRLGEIKQAGEHLQLLD